MSTDRQTPGQGKVENDHNQTGHKPPTAQNQGRRTPASRHDREDQVGSGNQSQSRQNTGPARGAG